MTALELPIGNAEILLEPQVSQSDFTRGASIRRQRSPFIRRVWRVTWGSLGHGAELYLRARFLDGGLGASILDWETPRGSPVKIRFRALFINQRSGGARDAVAELEEAIEPC